MRTKRARATSALILVTGAWAIWASLAHPGAQSGGTWTFAVIGDTRDPVTTTKTGISPDLAVLAAAVAAEKPELVLHTGDLCNGYYTTTTSPMHNQFAQMFRNWKTAVRPLYDYSAKIGIPIYPVRGNHEDGKYVTDKRLLKAYEDEIGPFVPRNGPAGEPPLTYSVTHRGARFLLLDGYYDKRVGVVRGYVNQAWIDRQLAGRKDGFLFAVSHTPAYSVGDYHESPFPDLYSHRAQRDRMWASFEKAGMTAYFAGHIHFYCRGTAAGVEQVVVGSGGADMVAYDPKLVDRLLTMHFPASAMKASEVPVSFLIVTVDEGAGTATGLQKMLDRKTGRWNDGDKFVLRLRSVLR